MEKSLHVHGLGKRLVFAFVAFIFIALLLSQPASAEVTRGPSFEETCNGNVCTRSLYSGTRFVEENSKWIPIEQAKSLKNVWNVVYLETDKNYGISVVDYNFTGIRVCLKPDASQIGQTIPFKYCNSTRPSTLDAKANYQPCKTEISKQFLSTKEECYTISTKEALVNYNFTFGEHSTTIQLQDADTEILDDTYSTSDGSSSHGNANWIECGPNPLINGEGYIWIRFNLTSLINLNKSTRIAIQSSILNLWLYDDYGNSVSESLEWYQVANYTWTEDSCYDHSDDGSYPNNCPTELTYIDTKSFENPGSDNYWEPFNITEWTNTEFSAGHLNVSVMINRTNNTLTDTSRFFSKEYSTNPAKRPYIVITYVVFWPKISISQPWNTTYDNNTINFNVTCTDNCPLDWVVVELSGSNSTNFTNRSGEWNYLNGTLADGTYEAKFWFNESADGDMNTTSIWFTIDTNQPQITIKQPWNVTYYNNTINFNITGNEVLSWAAVQIGNTNHTLTNRSGEWNYLNDTLSNAQYEVQFWFNDSVGNMNTTNITFTINKLVPITIRQPWNKTYLNNSISINITGEQFDWVAVEFDSDGYNQTLTNRSGEWNYLNNTVSDGSHNARICANDTVGNMNCTNIIFYIFTKGQQWYNNQSLIPSQYNPYSRVYFNITWNTTRPDLSNISWIWIESNFSGSAANYTATNTTYGGDIFNYTTPIIGTGHYFWRSYANNSGGYWNITDTWYFTITQNTSNPMYLNITYSGVSYIDSNIATTSDVSVKLQAYTNYSNAGTPLLWVNNVSFTNPTTQTWGVGTYNISINTTGNTNYTANTSWINFTMTITAPAATPGGGGGGGGATPASQCGNGFCEIDETETNCPLDCVAAIPNFTFTVLPTSGVISRFISANTNYSEVVYIENPNAQNISVAVFITCEEGDPSCNWWRLVDDDGKQVTELNVIVPGGTRISPGRRIVNVAVSIPENVTIKQYRTLISFKAIGQKKIISAELNDWTGIGVIKFLYDLAMTYVWGPIKVWMVLVVVGIILAIALLIRRRRPTELVEKIRKW